MNRLVVCVALAVAYMLARSSAPKPAPAPQPTPLVTPVDGLSGLVGKMSGDDRRALGEAYAILSRSVAASPTSDPVFPTTGSVRAAHRAALLCVWKGVLGNPAGKYPGLREALEGAVEKRIGKDDIPLNPALQSEAAQAFADIAATVR